MLVLRDDMHLYPFKFLLYTRGAIAKYCSRFGIVNREPSECRMFARIINKVEWDRGLIWQALADMKKGFFALHVYIYIIRYKKDKNMPLQTDIL